MPFEVPDNKDAGSFWVEAAMCLCRGGTLFVPLNGGSEDRASQIEYWIEWGRGGNLKIEAHKHAIIITGHKPD